jgi:hypothetical protein
VAVVGTWTSRTVTDTEAFVDRLGPVSSTPQVQSYLETQLTDQVSTVVIQGLVGSRVDAAIDGLDAPDLVKVLLRNLATSAGGWAQTRVERVSHKVVTAPQFQTAFQESLRASHGELIGILEGDQEQTVVADDRTVSIKVATLTNAIREELVSAGFDVATRIPEVQATIPITTVDQLEQWRSYYRMLKVLAWLGPLLVLALAGLGAWLLRDAVVAGLWFFAGAAVAVVALTLGIRSGVSAAVGGIRDPEAADAARSVVSTLTQSLATNGRVTLVVALLGLAVCVALMVRRGRREPPPSPWTEVSPRSDREAPAAS